MADHLSKKERSKLMSKIRSKRTKPEMTIHGHLKAAKVRHQMWPNWLWGSPDIVIGNTAVFIHGCFWHGCPEHFKLPKTNRRFWADKIRRNVERHTQAEADLTLNRWSFVVVWEHELRTLQGTRRVIEKLKLL